LKPHFSKRDMGIYTYVKAVYQPWFGGFLWIMLRNV